MLPEKPQPGGGSSQTSNQQISTFVRPAGLGLETIIEPFIPLFMHLYPKRYQSPPLRGRNLVAATALRQGLSSLERLGPGSEPAGPAGVRLQGVG